MPSPIIAVGDCSARRRMWAASAAIALAVSALSPVNMMVRIP